MDPELLTQRAAFEPWPEPRRDEPRWPVRRYDPLRWRRIGWRPSTGRDAPLQAVVEYISQETLTITATSGTVEITVPTDCTLAIVVWCGYSLSGLNKSSMTINSASLTEVSGSAIIGTASEYGMAIEYLLSPSTGSQTFAWTWTNAPLAGEGPVAAILYFKGNDASTPFRDADVQSNSGGGSSNSVTVDSATTDYVLGFCASWENTINCAPTSSGQTNLVAVWTTSGRSGRFGNEDAPGASSTPFTTDATDGMLSVVSIRVGGAPAPAEPPPPPQNAIFFAGNF